MYDTCHFFREKYKNNQTKKRRGKKKEKKGKKIIKKKNSEKQEKVEKEKNRKKQQGSIKRKAWKKYFFTPIKKLMVPIWHHKKTKKKWCQIGIICDIW